jgi:predicted dehydrogenase
VGIRLGIVGAGGTFAASFIPLFHAHPLVDEVVLCDLVPEKLAAAATRFGIALTSPSLDALLESDVGAVAVITQPWLHGQQAIQALRAGRHVYSAVPMAETLEEVGSIVRAVQDTGRIYMTGETSYYYPAAIFCREKFARGEFGGIVYGEGEYLHDMDHGLYAVHQQRGGERWRERAGAPPMYYPTHSVSMIVSVTGAHATSVHCHGIVDSHDDRLFGKGANAYDNPFGNQSALFKMSDGSAARINEFRRIGHPGAVRMSLFGTEGSFEQNYGGAMWLTKDKAAAQRVDNLMALDGATHAGAEFKGASTVHDVQRLPREFAGLRNGHRGSHQFLVDDFVKACVSGTQPPNHAWAAARYCVPGIVAHESATQGGALLDVPDFGPGPV